MSTLRRVALLGLASTLTLAVSAGLALEVTTATAAVPTSGWVQLEH